MAFDWPTYCVSQVLVLGGYWLIEPVVALAREGHCYDETLPDGYWEAFRQWMVDAGQWNEAFLGFKDADYAFPLDFVRGDIPPDFLYRQYEAARAGIDDGYCLGGQDGLARGRCLGCGACVDPEQRAAITQHRMTVPEAAPYRARLRETVTRKRRLRPTYYLLRCDELEAGVDPTFLNALAFRAILTQYPELVDTLLAVRESLFTVSPPGQGRRSSKRGRYPVMGGESVFALYAWDAEVLQDALSRAPADAQRETASAARWRVIAPAEAFTPGTFTSFHLHMSLPLAHFPGARQQLDRYLRDAYVPYSLRRLAPHAEEAVRYGFDVPQKGLKKKVLLGGHFEVGETAFEASLEVGPRFDLLAFLEQFAPAYHVAYARLRARAIRW
jgi:hypothetical protein